jgi:hypothetical protein
MRANGFHYDAVKIFCDKNGRVTKVPYREYVIPDVTAGIFWLKNRDPEHWRDSQQLEHVLGKYIISDQPMSEEQWARERATVIDAGPADGADARALENARKKASNINDLGMQYVGHIRLAKQTSSLTSEC